MPEPKVIVLQGSNIQKLQEELAFALKDISTPQVSITQSQSAVPVIGSRMGWENIVTLTVVYSE